MGEMRRYWWDLQVAASTFVSNEKIAWSERSFTSLHNHELPTNALNRDSHHTNVVVHSYLSNAVNQLSSQ